MQLPKIVVLCLVAVFQDTAPKPSVAVLDVDGTSLNFLDPETLSRLGQVKLGLGPHEIALSLDGRTAYVPLHGGSVGGKKPIAGHQIAVIDLASRKLERMIDIKPHASPYGIAVDRSGLLWVTCEKEGMLLVVDPAAKTPVVASITLGVKGTRRLLMNPERTRLYATNVDTPMIAVIDVESRRRVREIHTSHPVDGMAISPDGKTLYASAAGHPSLFVVDVEKQEVVREFPLDHPAVRSLVTPDGKTLLVVQPSATAVDVFDTQTFRRKGTVRLAKAPSEIATTPDGRVAYVSSAAGGTIACFDVESLRVLRTSAVARNPGGMITIGR